MTITRPVSFRRGSDRSQRLVTGEAAPPLGRIPRIARLMALAIQLEEVSRSGNFATQQQFADALHITQPRLTQIINLTFLAPDLQEELLFLPKTHSGRDAIHERMLRPVTALLDWNEQRAAWRRLLASTTLVGSEPTTPT